jgi:glycosidase
VVINPYPPTLNRANYFPSPAPNTGAFGPMPLVAPLNTPLPIVQPLPYPTGQQAYPTVPNSFFPQNSSALQNPIAPANTPFWTRPELAWPALYLPQSNFPQANYSQLVQNPLPTTNRSVSTTPSQLSAQAQHSVNSKPSTEAVQPLQISSLKPICSPSKLKRLFQNNQAILYALHLRTFGAEDKNHDGKITFHLGESGSFANSVKRLDELKELGVNAIHLLPIQPPGERKRLGEAGSVYAPKSYLEINPEYGSVADARQFVQEAHKRGIHVMVDVPSCASHDLALERPDLIALDLQGNPLVPTNWIDILMFQNGPALQDYYDGFFDLMVNQIGVDGFRVDVARARPTAFWDHFIKKYPNHAWLAESYTQEDASPMENIPRDIPEALLKVGFDSVYGQFHIFPGWANAYEYQKYLVEGNAMLKRAGVNKSFIGSFVTHDDHSLMDEGGATMHFLVSGLMATQPWTNPYILDGFTTGYDKPFDIFNFRPRPQGQHPEIGRFLQHMFKLRKQYSDIITQGLFIPIPLNQKSSKIIAFARHHQGKTMLIVANKDVNARSSANLSIPGLQASQALTNLAPSYGRKSTFTVEQNGLKVDLGPGRFHMFEIDTPELPLRLNSYR